MYIAYIILFTIINHRSYDAFIVYIIVPSLKSFHWNNASGNWALVFAPAKENMILLTKLINGLLLVN